MSDYSNPPINPASPLPFTAYYGTYHNPYFGTASIYQVNEQMTLWIGPQHMAFPLTHRDGNQFVFETIGENALGLSGAKFEIGPSGHAEMLILERYNQEGGGLFKRVDDERIQAPPRMYCLDGLQ
ncbi:hypothetical protein CCP4SC76_2640003 [Gammaproteobacteria bacterium]